MGVKAKPETAYDIEQSTERTGLSPAGSREHSVKIHTLDLAKKKPVYL